MARSPGRPATRANLPLFARRPFLAVAFPAPAGRDAPSETEEPAGATIGRSGRSDSTREAAEDGRRAGSIARPRRMAWSIVAPAGSATAGGAPGRGGAPVRRV